MRMLNGGQMFFVALATDYDGTLAIHGEVDEPTRQALRDLRASGRKLLLVTGRDLPDLKRVFDELELFDLVVAENGALLFDPAKQEEDALSEPPPEALVERLRAEGVSPLSVGRTIIATWEPNEKIVLEAIRDLALEQHIIFNKGAVMVLPGGVNKASGLLKALARLKLSPHNVVGIGDAENDQAFLTACGCAVAVENALDTVKAKADFVVADHGAGVIELAHALTENDLSRYRSTVPRSQPVIGETATDESVRITPFETVLVTGSSGSGKSTIVVALLEQLREQRYQFCVVDPEGDYSNLRDTVGIGDAKQVPRAKEVLELLAQPETNVVINLLSVDPQERPQFLAGLLPDLAKLRGETGRPHWIVLDEVHHCLPASWDRAPMTLPRELPALIAVTVHPEEVASDFLDMVSMVIGVGEGGAQAIDKFCEVTKRIHFAVDPPPEAGSVLVLRRDEQTPIVVTARRPIEKQQRHIRKYAEGELGEDRSFYFRGPDNALNLRAQNLSTFLQLAAGVDDNTWLHHLREGAYSRWFRDAVKDPELATEAAGVEEDAAIDASESRSRIKELVERRYTAPAKADRN